MVQELLIHLSAPRSSKVRVLLARLFWVIMLSGHLPALLASQSRLYEAPLEPTGLLRFCILILSVVYFSLKLLGFRFWKADPSWDRLVIYCLVVLLLHSGVVIDTNPPLGQSGLGWVHLISPFLVVLGGASLAVMIHQTNRQMRGLVPVPIAHSSFSRDTFPPLPAQTRSEILSSSLQRRGPPSSFFR